MELKEKVKAGIGKAVTYWKQYGAAAALWIDLIAVAVLYAMMTAHVRRRTATILSIFIQVFSLRKGRCRIATFFSIIIR